MHYYQHHIGDFVRDTSRLSDAQSMAYLRLLWAYYDKEQPLANSVEKLAFQIGASEKDVGLILEHFFKLDTEENVWRHKRCDAEIEAYKAKEEKARKSANARWGNKSSASKAQKTSSKDAQTVQPQCERNANASKSDANQEPITKNQEPINTHTHTSLLREDVPAQNRSACFETPSQAVLENPEPSPEPPPPPPEKPMLPSMAGAICVALKSQGIFDVNPSHPTLRALVDAGVGVDVFVQAAQTAVGRAKGFAYVLGIVKGQMAEAVKLTEAASAQAALAIKSASNNRQHERLSFRERDRELARDRYEEIFGKPHPDRVPKQERTIIDITPSATFLGVEK